MNVGRGYCQEIKCVLGQGVVLRILVGTNVCCRPMYSSRSLCLSVNAQWGICFHLRS